MQKQNSWKNLVIFLIASSFAYIFMEWLFLTTMPSYMSEMSLLSKLEIMIAAGGFLVCAGIVPIALLALIDLVVLKSEKRGILLYAALLVPAAIVSSLLLLLVDNFTYTVFKFGIVTLPGWGRGIYTVALVVLFIYIFRWGSGLVFRPARPKGRFDPMLTMSLGAILLAGLSAAGQYNPISTQALAVEELEQRPNILIIGSDGVNANNMSLYGYERDTTPNLEKIAEKSLVAENAFTNSGGSASSVASILTGKLPSKTRIYGEGSILMGSDSYQHLPGILNGQGYYSVEIGVPHYVDAYNLNFQGGFDEVNHRPSNVGYLFQYGTKLGFGSVTYFLEYTFERVTSRVFHILFIQTMENPYEVVTQLGDQIKLDDQEKIDQLLGLIAETRDPLFVHMHLMGSHGALFAPKHRIYSGGQEQTREWMTDFYDDSIYDFDVYVKEIFDALSASGKLDNTVVVIYTDHNMLHETNQRIPLIIHFPRDEFAGAVRNNTQNIDIAPTILDYLGIPVPEWMDGRSLLRGEPSADRLVYSSNINELAVTVVECNRWYRFEHRGVWFTGDVNQHTQPCPQADISTLSDLPEPILAYLDENEFALEDKPENASAYLSFSGNPTLSQVAVILLRAKYGPDYTPPPPTGLFEDVPLANPDAGWIEQSYLDGIVSSCAASPLKYCPDSFVTRAQLAEYLLKAKNGGEYTPQPAEGVFADVPVSSPYAPWVEELYRRKITGGCSVVQLNYCPDAYITGGQLTVFLNSIFDQP